MVFDFFKKISTPTAVALVTLTTIFVFCLINFHGVPGVPRNPVVTELGLPDMMIKYSPGHTYDLLDAYGAEGRHAYSAFLERVDFIFPLLYGFSFVMVATIGFVRIFPTRPEVQKLALLPFATTFFDFAENSCFLVMLRNYPARLYAVARIANVCTLAKWGFALISLVLALISLIGLLTLKFRRPAASRTA